MNWLIVSRPGRRWIELGRAVKGQVEFWARFMFLSWPFVYVSDLLLILLFEF